MVEKKTPAAQQPEQQQLQLHADPNLEYKYRDLFNLHVGAEDVLVEFGNLHRSQQSQGVILDRIILSPANAIRLHQGLGQALSQMQTRLKEMREEAEKKA